MNNLLPYIKHAPRNLYNDHLDWFELDQIENFADRHMDIMVANPHYNDFIDAVLQSATKKSGENPFSFVLEIVLCPHPSHCQAVRSGFRRILGTDLDEFVEKENLFRNALKQMRERKSGSREKNGVRTNQNFLKTLFKNL